MNRCKKFLSVMLALLLIICNFNVSIDAKNRKPYLSSAAIELFTDANKTVTVKGIDKRQIRTVSVKSSANDIAYGTSVNKKKIRITAKKEMGAATITIVIGLNKKINNKKKYTFQVDVVVFPRDEDTRVTPTPTPISTEMPVVMPTVKPSEIPSVTPSATPSIPPATTVTPTVAPTVKPTMTPVSTQQPSINPLPTSSPTEIPSAELEKNIVVDTSGLSGGVIKITNTSKVSVQFRMSYQCLDSTGTSINSGEFVQYVLFSGENIYKSVAYRDYDKIADFKYTFKSINQNDYATKYNITYEIKKEPSPDGNGDIVNIYFTNHNEIATHHFDALVIFRKNNKIIGYSRPNNVGVSTVLEPNIPFKSSINDYSNYCDDIEISIDVN